MQLKFKKFIIVGAILFSAISITVLAQKKQAVQEINLISQVEEAVESETVQSETSTIAIENASASGTANNELDKTLELTELPEQKPIEIDYEKVKPNEVGDIMIVMYHGILYDEPSSDYQRNVDDFKNDLETMYNKGYRLISMQDLIDNNIKVEAGYTPIVLTFDDGISSSFSLDEIEGKLVPKENCAVDIINKFSEQHPDFGRAAAFYINGKREPFKGSGTLTERFNYLITNGYEIGNHTFNHNKLSELNETEIQEEIGLVHKLVLENTDGHILKSITYPFGIRPKAELLNYALAGEYDGVKYQYSLAIREGQSGASASPNNVKFDPLNVPRVRGSSNSEMDLGWFFDYYENNPSRKYVSDGDASKISVPSEKADLVNQDSVKDKELYLYELQQ